MLADAHYACPHRLTFTTPCPLLLTFTSPCPLLEGGGLLVFCEKFVIR
jgi:hypothetical protein